MCSFRILDHTADLKIEFSGKNLEELLNQCVLCISEYLYGKKADGSSKTYKRIFKVEDELEFLITFLNELLYLMQYKNFIPSRVLLLNNNENYIVYFKGEKAYMKPLSEIKAATYHNAKIERDGNNLRAIITFDL